MNSKEEFRIFIAQLAAYEVFAGYPIFCVDSQYFYPKNHHRHMLSESKYDKHLQFSQ